MSDWDDDEDEEWEDDSPSGGASGFGVSSEVMRSVTLGFLACLPLWIAYEVALSHAGVGWRGTAEILVLRGLKPLGEHVTLVRRLLMLALTIAAGIAFARRHHD